MGLASKLAASSGAPPASYPGGPPAPLQAGQQPRPAYPGQQQYQAYPGGGQPAQQGPPAASVSKSRFLSCSNPHVTRLSIWLQLRPIDHHPSSQIFPKSLAFVYFSICLFFIVRWPSISSDNCLGFIRFQTRPAIMSGPFGQRYYHGQPYQNPGQPPYPNAATSQPPPQHQGQYARPAAPPTPSTAAPYPGSSQSTYPQGHQQPPPQHMSPAPMQGTPQPHTSRVISKRFLRTAPAYGYQQPSMGISNHNMNSSNMEGLPSNPPMDNLISSSNHFPITANSNHPRGNTPLHRAIHHKAKDIHRKAHLIPVRLTPPAQPPTPQQLGAYKQLLLNTINEKGLQNMYPPNSPVLDQIVSRITNQIDQLCTAWRVPREVGQDIVKLALFDVILYIDDSGSMQFEENGERIKDLKLILSRVAYAASLFDDDGIQVRFMNSNEQGDGIRSEAQVEALIQRIQFKGLTPMGTSLRNKVLEPLVVGPARAGQLRKPVLIVTITDGQPAGEPQGAVFDAIRYASSELQNNPRYGRGAVSFQFAQVGNDLKAREFLSKLDEEPGIGELVDCTSNFEVEQDEMSRANPPVDLTPDLWLAKMILGAIDSSYDTRDEKASRPANSPDCR
ncbi:RfeF [Coccidioides immitis H538.4]|uniref:RfeF n=1 Tax=Coccidioides immitis H538.4 TaxID=396776 RepID=A0A0J8RNU1_COCIT|nr:RfeF [Coccidioides immitis H538.4]